MRAGLGRSTFSSLLTTHNGDRSTAVESVNVERELAQALLTARRLPKFEGTRSRILAVVGPLLSKRSDFEEPSAAPVESERAHNRFCQPSRHHRAPKRMRRRCTPGNTARIIIIDPLVSPHAHLFTRSIQDCIARTFCERDRSR